MESGARGYEMDPYVDNGRVGFSITISHNHRDGDELSMCASGGLFRLEEDE